MCMTSRGRNDIWPSLVEKAVGNRTLWSFMSLTLLNSI